MKCVAEPEHVVGIGACGDGYDEQGDGEKAFARIRPRPGDVGAMESRVSPVPEADADPGEPHECEDKGCVGQIRHDA